MVISYQRIFPDGRRQRRPRTSPNCLVSAFMAAPTDRFSPSLPALRAPVGCAAPDSSVLRHTPALEPRPDPSIRL